MEGSRLRLRCESRGGHPAPRLLWFRDGSLLDSSFSRISSHRISESTARVVNLLSLDRVDRRDAGSLITCRACNSLSGNLSSSASASLVIRLAPHVRILERKATTHREGERISLTCISRPASSLSWRLEDRLLPASQSSAPAGSESSSSSSASVLHLVASADLDGRRLVCSSVPFPEEVDEAAASSRGAGGKKMSSGSHSHTSHTVASAANASAAAAVAFDEIRLQVACESSLFLLRTPYPL